MASAVIASRNEPYWGEHKVYMRKYTATANNSSNYNNPSFLNLKTNPNRNPNPTSKPIPNPNRQIQIHDQPSNLHFRQRELSPLPPARPAETSVPPPPPPFRKTVCVDGPKESSNGRHVTFHLGVYTKRELKELKRRLISELEQVRTLKTRLDSLGSETRPIYPPSQFSTTRPTPPLHFNTPTAAATTTTITTPQPTQTKKKGSGPGPGRGHKRSNPLPCSSPNLKRPVATATTATVMDPCLSEKVLTSMMKRCGQILTKLMKQKHAWIFNTPVDVVGLRLFDYHQIIKKPMDLGTVKSNLDKSDVYKSPLDFAADVRLTFDNAMVYNPKEHEVHVMAQQFLAKFNEMFDSAYKKFEEEKIRVSRVSGQNQDLFQPVQPRLEFPVQPVQPRLAFPVQSVQVLEGRVGVKLPKPKARDPNKREMSYEEKAKLGKDLEKLPQEKMLQLLQIVRKRNSRLTQDGDEIELDIEAMDTETLWELDRFVVNYKKMVSKIKRQSLICNQSRIMPNAAAHISQVEAPMSEMVEVGHKVVGEEDVDIGEEIPVGNYPSVEIEKDVNVAGCASGKSGSSSSTGSGSDSSSSSGSDSGSSSGSDSDAGSVQSPYVEAHRFHM